MSCGSCCSSGCGPCLVCKIASGIVGLLVTVTTVATLIGVWMTHNTPEGWAFGTPNGSLSVIAFVVSAAVWLKIFKKMCGCCGKKGGACKDGACTDGGCGDGSCGGK